MTVLGEAYIRTFVCSENHIKYVGVNTEPSKEMGYDICGSNATNVFQLDLDWH